MHLRCKEGDLALVIHDEECCRDNIGKLVRVAGPMAFNHDLQKNCWLIQPVRRKPWGCVNAKGEAYRKVLTFASNVEHPDDWLLPIDPLLWSVDEETQAQDNKTESGSAA